MVGPALLGFLEEVSFADVKFNNSWNEASPHVCTDIAQDLNLQSSSLIIHLPPNIPHRAQSLRIQDI